MVSSQHSIQDTAADLRSTRIDVDVMTRTGPDTLAGRYMRNFWQPVLTSQELPAGRALPVQIMGESFTLYRGEGGVPHAVANRCAHRCAQLSVGYVEGDNIRCLYHGWLFDADGQCLEQPAEPDNRAAKGVRIGSYPVFEYLGLIFIFIGKGEVPPRPRFPEFEEPGVLEANFYERECNYFQNVENGVDEAHLPFTHRKSLFDVLNHDVPLIGAEETEYGLVQTGTRSDGTVRMSHCLMPNLLSFVLPPTDPAVTNWSLYLSWRVPIDDTKHRSYIVEHFKVKPEEEERFRARRRQARERLATLPSLTEVGSAILAGKARLEDFVDRPDFVNLQDDIAQRAQDVNQDRSIERLARSDVAIAMLRRLWARDLAAVAAGERPTQWRYPERLPRPTGV